MDPAPRLVPATTPKTVSLEETTNSFGLHDTLQYGPRNFSAEITATGTSGLKHRLDNWEATQDNLRLVTERNVFGLHMPMRKLMERKLVSHDPHMPAFRQSNIHLDILMGRDETLQPSDFMMPASELTQPMDIHADMEKKLRM